MKHLLLLLLLPVTLVFTGSFYPANDAIKLQVKKGKIKVNDIVISDWKLASALQALGQPERPRDGYNKTHTYDNKGIVLFEPMENGQPSGRFSEAQFYFFVSEPNNVTPKGTYTGSIKVDKLVVTSALTPAVMRAKLKKWTESESYMEHIYRMASNGVYIYFKFSSDERTLEKISVGIDTAK